MLEWLIKLIKNEITLKDALTNKDFWYSFIIYYAITISLIWLAIFIAKSI
jgi:hypothetical protein